MWDIKICCDSCYRDIFKAYFIVNDFDYTEQEDGIVFYADGLDNFFAVVNGLDDFYHEHKKVDMESIDFVINAGGGYCITPMRYTEEG